MKKRLSYIDASFPPSRVSLLGAEKAAGVEGAKLKISLKEKAEWEIFKWEEISKIPDMQPFTISSPISPLEVKQGFIGNCYFVSSIVSLAMIPERIAKLFPKISGKDGVYECQAYFTGILTPVKLDGFFPYSPSHESLAFTKSEANELWPMLLEKAWAKFLGSYQAITSNSPAFAFDFLSGFPTETIEHETLSKEELWQLLLNAQEKKFPMVASTHPEGKNSFAQQYEELGLASGHAYTLLDIKEGKGTKRAQKLIRLRNPWRRLEWKGGVDIGSNVMPSVLKRTGEGIFHMSLDHFKGYFSSVTICKYHDGYFSNSVPLKADKDLSEFLVDIEIKGPSHVYFTIHEDFNSDAVTSGMIIGYQNPATKNWEYIGSSLKKGHFSTIEHNSTCGGTYKCYIQIVASEEKSKKKFSLGTNSSSPLSLKLASKLTDKDAFLISVLRSCAIKKGPKAKLSPGIYQYDCFAESKIFYSAYHYINFSEDTTLHVKVQFKGAANDVMILPPFDGLAEYTIEVPPKTEKTVTLKTTPETRSLEFSSRVLFQKSKAALLKEIQIGGEKPMSDVSIAPGFSYRAIQHDFGVVFQFSNTSANKLFTGWFAFKLTNMEFEDKQTTYELELHPNEITYKWAYSVEMFGAGKRYSVKYNYEEKTIGKTDESIIKELLESGKKMVLTAKKANLWTKYIEGDYCLYIVNDSEQTLHATVEFKDPQNLNCTNGETWDVEIANGEKGELKIIRQKKCFAETKCGLSVSHSLS